MKGLKFVFAMVAALSPSQFAPAMAAGGDDAATGSTDRGSDVFSTSLGIAAQAAAVQEMDMGALRWVG